MRKKTAKVILLFQREKQVLLRGVEKKKWAPNGPSKSALRGNWEVGG